jgi:uncharacterized protein
MLMLDIWLFVAALGSSLVGGLLGMASGIFIVPILTFLFGMSIRASVGVSLVSVIACSCGSAAPFFEQRLTNVKLAIVLECATTFGALCGVSLAGLISPKSLYVLFAIVLILSARQMLTNRKPASEADGSYPAGWSTALGLHSSYIDHVADAHVPYRVGSVPLGLLLMYCAGLLSALLGIGSGVLKIPAMDSALHLPLKVSSATSNFMISVTAAASAGAYYAHGDIDALVAGPVALGSVIGALIGAKMLIRLPIDGLRVALAVILVLLAGQMLLSGVGGLQAIHL